MTQTAFPWAPAPQEPQQPSAEPDPAKLRLLIDERLRTATPRQLAKILDGVMRVTRKGC